MVHLRTALLTLLILCAGLGSASADLLLGAVVRGDVPPRAPEGVERLLADAVPPAGNAWSVEDLFLSADIVQAAEQALQSGAEGLCLRAFRPAGWDDRPLDTDLLAAFSRRYGRSPRPAPFDGVDGALLAGLRAEIIGEVLADIRAAAPSLKLALACDAADLTAYSAAALGLDVPGYLAAGLLDEVMVRCPEPRSLMGLKLATDREVTVWSWCSAQDAGQLRGAVATALRCPGVDGLILDAPLPLDTMAADVNAARVRHVALRQRQEELAKAVAEGDLVSVAGFKPEGQLDQANLHDVAQSFTVAEDTLVAAVGIFACLRGAAGAALPEMPLTIRTDGDGRPGEVLGSARLYPDDLSSEPRYKWVYAELESPVALQAGKTYWLHGPEVTAAGSSYMWRIVRGGVYPDGQAWSSKYDYSAVDWVFRILAKKEAR